MEDAVAEYVLPEQLSDPAFNQYVDISLLELAWKTKDAALMTDVALQLRQGEEVLMRSHKAGSAADLLRLSIAIASRDGDKELLDRIGKVAKAKELEDVAALTTQAAKLAGATRKDEPELSVPVGKTSPSEFAEYSAIVNDIRSAALLGDTTSLESLEKDLDQYQGLTDKQREYLKRIAGEARAAKPDAATQDNSVVETINKIRGDTRHGGHGHHGGGHGHHGGGHGWHGGGHGWHGGGHGWHGGGHGWHGGGHGWHGGGHGWHGGGH